MRRFSLEHALMLAVGWVVADLAVTVVWLTGRARATARQLGHDPGDLYLVQPLRAWWVALLLLPPVVILAATWARRRAGARGQLAPTRLRDGPPPPAGSR